MILSFFFFSDTATTEIYTLSLHDALPISGPERKAQPGPRPARAMRPQTSWRGQPRRLRTDRKSTRLNSSHVKISYAVFCLKKKKRERCGKSADTKTKESACDVNIVNRRDQ